MKYLTYLAVLFLTACASTPYQTPVAVKTTEGVHVNSVVLHSTCKGPTMEEAKDMCFSKAIENVVGSVLLATTEVKDNKLIRDNILKHSSGYISNYTILSTKQVNGMYELEMDMSVRSSRIANRLLGKMSDAQSLQSDRLAAKYVTYMRDRSTGDAIIDEVVGDFPKNAFIVKRTSTEFKMRANRTPVIAVSYSLSWNNNYAIALREMLNILQDGQNNYADQQKFIVQYYPPGNKWLGQTDRFFFSDHSRAAKIRDYLDVGITVMFTVSDINGNPISINCSIPEWLADGPNITNPSRYETGYSIYRTAELPLPKNADAIRLAETLKLEVVSDEYCKNERVKTL